MPQIFPPEIIEGSAEYYYTKLSSHSRIIYVSTVLFVLISMILLPFIYVDITIQSEGIIRTSHENILIQSVIYSKIDKYNLKENEWVNEGDTLLTFDASSIDEKINLNQNKVKENNIFIEDISMILCNRVNFQTKKYQGKFDHYISKINIQNNLVDYLKNEQFISKTLYGKKVISESEYIAQENNYNKENLSLESLKNEFISELKSEQTELNIENKELDSSIKQLKKEKENYVILAPTSGRLVNVAGFQTNNFISPTQTIAFISSEDSLLAECYVSTKDIGYLRLSQKVRFQMDAFNYREWGMINGEIIELLNEAVDFQGSSKFRVRCKLYNTSLMLKNGYKGSIKKGMTLTGRFYLTRRNLWQLLFDKADSWLNPQNHKTR